MCVLKIKNTIKFIELVINDLNSYISVKKAAKAPRARKAVPVEKIVEVIKEIPVDKVVIKEVIKEIPVEKIIGFPLDAIYFIRGISVISNEAIL